MDNIQSVVALSTTEVEYIALSEAMKEVVWLLGIVNELAIQHNRVIFHCDNQSAIHLSKHQMFHERRKHIDVKLHFCERYSCKKIIWSEKNSKGR